MFEVFAKSVAALGAEEGEIIQYLLIAAYVIMSVSGVVLIKLDSNTQRLFSFDSGSLSIHVGYLFVLGLLCYIVSFSIYIGLISKYNLSYIVPITTGLIYTIMFVVSITVFRERLTFVQSVGSACVLVGIVMINIKA